MTTAVFSAQVFIRSFTSSRLCVGSGRGVVEEEEVDSDDGVERGDGEDEDGVGFGGSISATSIVISGSGCDDEELDFEDESSSRGGDGGACAFDREAKASSANCSRVAELIFKLPVDEGGAPRITGPSPSAKEVSFGVGPAGCCCSSGYLGTCLTDDPEKCRACRVRGRTRDSEVAALSIESGTNDDDDEEGDEKEQSAGILVSSPAGLVAGVRGKPP
jgi:hypothetical protein